MQILIFFILSILSYFGVSLFRSWLLRNQVLDKPNQRSSHSVPTPRGGGLSIVLLTILTALVFSLVTSQWRQGLIYALLGGLVAWIGWQDDVRSLSPKVRFLFQGTVGVLTILGLGYFRSVHIPMLGELDLGLMSIPVTFIWIIGLINAYNFMDGIDGIAGGVALAGGLGWMALSLPGSSHENPLVFWLALAIAASSLGFLGHNWPPARIFMGDLSSTFLGYSFAVLPLLSSNSGGESLMFGTAIMWMFILDSVVTFVGRLIRREPVFEAHRSHLYQRMTIGGWKHARVSVLFITLTLYAALLAVGWLYEFSFIAPLLFPGLPILWVLLSWYTARLSNAN